MKTKVALLSVFHFENPRLDLIKHRALDVMDEDGQAYLIGLARQLSTFRPNVVLLEFSKDDDDEVNKRYKLYREEETNLRRSEIEQIGFRVAREMNLNRVDGFDVRDTPWKAEALLAELKQDPQLETRFYNEIQKRENEFATDHSRLSLGEILRKMNGAQHERANKSLYLMTNVVGVDTSFAGADAAASWWHRNFRMLARIQRFSDPGQRLLVIAGQGHIALLRDLIGLDDNFEMEDIQPYL